MPAEAIPARFIRNNRFAVLKLLSVVLALNSLNKCLNEKAFVLAADCVEMDQG